MVPILKVWLLAVCLFGGNAFAMSEGRLQKSVTLYHGQFEVPEGKGTVHVIIREDGHVYGQPYVVELRPDCGVGGRSLEFSGGTSKPADVSQLHVKDAYSSCGLPPAQAISLTEDSTQLRLNIFELDSLAIQKAVDRNQSVQTPPCKSQSKEVLIDLKRFCR